MGIPWYILALPILLQSAFGLKLERGDSKLIYNFTLTADSVYTMYLEENNHVNGSNNLLLFYIDEAETQPTVSFLQASTFQNSINNISDTKYEFNATQYFDYETQSNYYQIKCEVEGVYYIILIYIVNIDDESPTLTSPMCSMKENVAYDKTNTECNCTLQDPDGWLSQTTFKIINSNPAATSYWEMEDQLFEFDFDRSIPDNEYSTTVYITTLQTLDYEQKIFYSFGVQAKDGANHSTTPKENVTCIIDVVDQNDQPPQWTDYFTTQQITEEQSYSFNVTATDGDKGINAEIEYSLISFDEDVCGSDPCVSITKVDKTGVITVKPIDRDALDLTIYKFELMAQEKDEPPYTANITITFFIEDIDDNSPLFMSLTTTNASNINYTIEDTKIAEFTFYENFAGTIDGQIFIQDIDTGLNAQFNVELLEDDSQNSEVQYTDAFLIVPSAGYRSGTFQISVKNSTYLDFEEPLWQNFQFYVHSSGTVDPNKKDDLLVKISLLDYNDEEPIFEIPSYTTTVNETIKKGETIIQVKATDRDAEDAILTHRLVGADTILKLLDINTTEGIITVAENNAFDYDRINPVIFQVEAIDHASPEHVTTVSVTVNLIDINNKAPTYLVGNVIRVDENQDIGIPLNATITASDVDTTRNLTAEIDWDKSYVTKNSIRLNSSEPIIEKAMKFLNLSFSKTSTDTISITLTVNDNNDANTAPDYETFDTLYLDINITDLNTEMPEFEKEKSVDALIVININDINDNPPIFTQDTIIRNRTVYEMAQADTIVGTIEAIDADVGDIVTYTCWYVNKTYDWFTCDSKGEITVKTSKAIDCDTDGIYHVNITCNATDGVFNDTHEFSIFIRDRNNKYPQIMINDTNESVSVVEVYEKSEPNTNVTTIFYTDADRDLPFKTSICSFRDQNEKCYEQFKVENNVVVVTMGKNELDRDKGDKEYSCNVTCEDNPTSYQDDDRLSNVTQFTIRLRDINDHCPELQTSDLLNGENLKKGDIIGNVIAKDIDEGDNADIDIKILTVTNDDDNSNFTDKNLFIMKNNSDYFLNLTYKQWDLVANADLRDYYGEYTLQLELSDHGDPPQSTEKNETLREMSKIKLIISKYNYYEPEFIFPSEDNNDFTLTTDQEVGQQLILFSYDGLNDNMLPDINIIDGEDDTCLDKWNPTFSVSLKQPANVTNFFMVKSLTTCTAQLQLNENYNKAEATAVASYELTLTTNLSNSTPSDNNELAYTKSINLTISFVSLDDDPVFNQSLVPLNVSIPETYETWPTVLPDEYKAHYSSDKINRTVFYFLDTADDNINNTFEVGLTTGTIDLKHELDYLMNTNYSFNILAARNLSGLWSNSDSLLPVTVYVEDVNNHVPQWTQSIFFGAIMRSTQKGNTVTKATATDEDVIDQDKLNYTFNGDIDRTGSDSIQNIENPFLVDETTGNINLNFIVEYNMYGHFVFSIKVEDVVDKYGNGPHENETTVTIYIVTEDNTLTFRFENSLDTVVTSKEKMTRIISDGLGWECHDYSIDDDSQNGVVLDNVTACNIYCVVDNTTLLTADEIKSKLNNINTFRTIKQELLAYGLLLLEFSSDTTTSNNLEATLKAALIGVSVVLGSLCIVLAVTFFLKARELSRRLERLTEPQFGSDESNLNRKKINAPTSNVFAVEGSNPIFNSEVKKDDFLNFDKRSIQSGDSELIGIEDSPEFDGMFIINNDQDKTRF